MEICFYHVPKHWLQFGVCCDFICDACPDSSWKLSCESGFWCKLYGALLPLQVTVMTQPRFHFQCLRILSNASSN